jgi:hypothetical protein
VGPDDGQAHRLSGQGAPERAVLAVHADRVAGEQEVDAPLDRVAARAQQRAGEHEQDDAASRERDRRLPGTRRQPDRQQRFAGRRIVLDAERSEQSAERHALDVAPWTPYPTSVYRHRSRPCRSVSGVSRSQSAQVRHHPLIA